MFARRHSYIPALKPRQSLRAGAAVLLALSLGGCAGLGLPFGAETASVDATKTGSIRPTLVSASLVDGVNNSDWEAIRRAVAATAADASVDRLPGATRRPERPARLPTSARRSRRAASRAAPSPPPSTTSAACGAIAARPAGAAKDAGSSTAWSPTTPSFPERA